MTFVYIALCLTILLLCLERLFPARADPTQHRINFAMWAVRLPLHQIVLPAIGAAIAEAARRAALPSLHVSTWPFALGAATYLLIHDFGEFAFHRAQHSIPWLWRLHALHHSDPCMSATTADRHFWGDGVIKAITIWPATALLLQPSAKQYVVFTFAYFYNSFIHANLPVNFGRLGWILNSPAYHRLHHSQEPEHFNRNFVALFPIWDVICGTYRRPDCYPRTGLAGFPPTLMDALLWPLRRVSAPIPTAEAAVESGERLGEPRAAS